MPPAPPSLQSARQPPAACAPVYAVLRGSEATERRCLIMRRLLTRCNPDMAFYLVSCAPTFEQQHLVRFDVCKNKSVAAGIMQWQCLAATKLSGAALIACPASQAQIILRGKWVGWRVDCPEVAVDAALLFTWLVNVMRQLRSTFDRCLSVAPQS